MILSPPFPSPTVLAQRETQGMSEEKGGERESRDLRDGRREREGAEEKGGGRGALFPICSATNDLY